MHHRHDATELTEHLRASLVEVVSASGVCGGRPIKVSPRSLQQFQNILRICCFHKVGWTLECDSKMIDSGEVLDVDVVLSLTILMASHKVAGSLLAPTAAIQPQHHGASLKSEPQ
jgi:hypothetical protein